MIRFAHCFFCDDIRLEVNNKQSYIGVYASELIVEELPTNLTQLGLVVFIVSEYQYPIEDLTLKVDYQGTTLETIVKESEITSKFSEALKKIEQYKTQYTLDDPIFCEFKVHASFPNFHLESPGPINVWANTGGQRYLAGRLMVLERENEE